MNRALALGPALSAVLALAPTAVPAQSPELLDPAPPAFPPLTAENLLGESFDLPDDLPGEIRIVFIAFRQRQQSSIDTWLAVADALEVDYAGLRYFELPTISRPFRLLKPVIDNGMRGGIPSEEARRRTITLFTSVSRFVEATRLPGTEDIATLLLDSDGRVRWHVTGVHTREREARLRQAIEAVREEQGESPRIPG